jgi:hypothetical protein
VPRNPTQLAVLAVELADRFEADDPSVAEIARAIDAL